MSELTRTDPLPPVAPPLLDAQGRRICGAHSRSTGAPCRQPAMDGQARCRLHGGGSPQARRAARARLAEEVDPSIERLVWERDHAEKDSDRIRAAIAILDRAGFGPRLVIGAEDARDLLIERLRDLRASTGGGE